MKPTRRFRHSIFFESACQRETGRSNLTFVWYQSPVEAPERMAEDIVQASSVDHRHERTSRHPYPNVYGIRQQRDPARPTTAPRLRWGRRPELPERMAPGGARDRRA